MSPRPSLASRLAAAAGAPSPVPAPAAPQEARAPDVDKTPSPVAKARRGKTMIAGYFSQEMARAIKMLAVERGVTVQALIGEGLDAVLRQHQRHPFGER